ncbi:DUF1488 family protein [Paludibacterium sp. dN 18-1]|uniref:DUF1488 family protein n=1 Tax=Paludibacterium denitrificans TaxID=2675226 RepID=A0A844GGK3_9NEIS|nr:DUF1488 family protein [Paludibacterium denitrificans]
MNITFPAGKHGFNGTRMCVSFQAIVDGSTKLVFISTEALQDVYKLSPEAKRQR